jgi:hypothetical protein
METRRLAANPVKQNPPYRPSIQVWAKVREITLKTPAVDVNLNRPRHVTGAVRFSMYGTRKSPQHKEHAVATHSPQRGEDTAPSYYSGGFPQKMREEYHKQWHAEHDVPPGQEPLTDQTVYHGDDWDDERPHLWNFFQAVKSRKPVVEDAVFGNHAAIACHMANESYFRKKPVFWDSDSRSIKD